MRTLREKIRLWAEGVSGNSPFRALADWKKKIDVWNISMQRIPNHGSNKKSFEFDGLGPHIIINLMSIHMKYINRGRKRGINKIIEARFRKIKQGKKWVGYWEKSARI